MHQLFSHIYEPFLYVLQKQLPLNRSLSLTFLLTVCVIRFENILYLLQVEDNICKQGIFLVQIEDNICNYRIFLVQDNANMHFGDNLCILWIFRVQDNANIMHFGDISSRHLIEFHFLHCKIMTTINHSTHLIFHGDFAQAITNVRKVELYESKLGQNCGQFHSLFS